MKKNTDGAHNYMTTSVLNFDFNKKSKNYGWLISSRRSKNRRPPNIIFTINIWEHMVGIYGHRLDRKVS